MMRILVTGGTGVLGREIVEAAEAAGHVVRVGSRGPRRAGAPDAREWAVMDLASGSGIDEAVAEVDVVIHAASDPKRSQAADVDGTRALVDACTALISHSTQCPATFAQVGAALARPANCRARRTTISAPWRAW